MAILPLNFYAQDEATYSQQSDIIIIRSTQRLANEPRLCAELQELYLQDRQLLVSVKECRARLCLVAAAHVTARTQELYWQQHRLISVLLVLVSELT